MIWILTTLMLVVAVVFSAFGQGGGVLYTPIQVWLGIGFHTAATTSLFLIMIASLSSSIVFRKAGKIDWPLALVLESSTTLGGFAGGLSSGRFSGAFLSMLFAAVMVVASFFMIRQFEYEHECPTWRHTLFAWRRSVSNQEYCANLAVALPASFAVGLISGLVGVGGGILKVPLMVLLLGIPMDIAVGSSAFMIGVTASGGFAGHVINGHWDWRTSLVLAVAVFVGGQLGSRVGIRIDKRKLKRGFGWLLLAVGASMVLKALV